jgi:hypothetical protein
MSRCIGLGILLVCLTGLVQAEEMADINGLFKNSTKGVPFSMVLPKNMYAASGSTMSLYLENIIISRERGLYNLKVDSPLGSVVDNVWSLQATDAQVGKHDLAVKIFKKSDNSKVAEGTITLHVSPEKVKKEKSLTVLMIGDSLTAATVYPKEVSQFFSKDKSVAFTMLGTRKKGNGVAHEGYGGWRWESFASKYTDTPLFQREM